MNQVLTSLIFFSFFTVAFCQAPQGIPYQSAMRNSSGGILANQTVAIRFSIRDSSITGIIVYQETHGTATNNQGIVSLSIGQGTPTLGTFAGINWAQHSKFLQVEIDATGGTSYVDLGTQQMMSVPFALYTGTAGNLITGNSPTTIADSITNISSAKAKIFAHVIGRHLSVNSVFFRKDRNWCIC